MERKILYIINPISGRSNKASLRALVEARTKAAGIPYEIHPSLASGDYSQLHEPIINQQFTDIVVAGGDGTINQAVNSLRTLQIPFGIIPCGSGNGLAFSAGIPKNPDKALDIIFKGSSQLTDAFMVNDRFACMLCGLGFDAQVAHDFARDANRGLMTYIKKTVSHFFTATSYPFILKLDQKEIKT